MYGLHLPLNFPDLWQQEAVRALKAGRDVVVDAPTGAGKTHVFELYAGDAARRGQMVYTVPTRALANEKWRDWKGRGWNVGIATGDIAENTEAPVIVATLETQRERILTGAGPALLVVDEYQMLADERRGLNYELAVALLPRTSQLLLLSGSVRNPHDIVIWLERLGRSADLIQVRERPVPLDEVPVECLPRVSDKILGFWPRLAVAAVKAGLAPLLIFAPRRSETERIARKIADVLPLDSPFAPGIDASATLGKELERQMQRRVAHHHSGLSYNARAEWIEPLAKRGELKVIVATTGLAAGINFSVRAVLVSDITYFDGPYQRQLRPDELLQMFGRAGRRGLDPRGVVLAAQDSPRLADATPLQLRRLNQIDWPTLLRVMEQAVSHGVEPFAEAGRVCERLFSKQRISVGIEPARAAAAGTKDCRYGPTRQEILDSTGTWSGVGVERSEYHRLADCLAIAKDSWKPALRCADVIAKLGAGCLCKLRRGKSFIYGRELPVARILDDGRLNPLPWLRKRLRLPKGELFDTHTFQSSLMPLLAEQHSTGRLDSLVHRGKTLAAQFDPSDLRVRVTVDCHGKALLNPPRRRIEVASETHYASAAGEHVHPAPGSAAHAWRQLGLVDERGHPTLRGQVFSRFQAGEGLMIAAAIDDKAYAIDDLVLHLANVRGGHRFAEIPAEGSERLAAVARGCYGHRDHPGYLRAGLCETYGEGTCEAIQRFRGGGIRALAEIAPDVRRGDVERALLEWLSLLRHIFHAPPPSHPRWSELRSAVVTVFERIK